jgi:hypothetical protein
MANEIKYNNVDWAEGTPIAGERLATNGYYTGEHKGSVMQDGKYADANSPHCVENAIVRLGTMTQDAIDENFPTVAE